MVSKLRFVEPAGDVGEEKYAPQPVEIYGLPEVDVRAPSFEEMKGAVRNVLGGDLQEILESLSDRLSVLENPA